MAKPFPRPIPPNSISAKDYFLCHKTSPFLKSLADGKESRDTLRAVASAKLREHPNQEVELLRWEDHPELRADCEHTILVAGRERGNGRA
jgi:hypothetical protein